LFESESSDEVLYHEELISPYNNQDVNNILQATGRAERNHQSSTGGKDWSSSKNF